MEAGRKDKMIKTGTTGEMRWPEWIQALQDNSRVLRGLLESANWEPLQRTIRHREKLLRDAAEHLGLSARICPTSLSSGGKADIKMALQAALDANRELMHFMQTRQYELKSKIGDLSKGRKLLKLYKTHRQAAPRFFDKFG